MPGAHETVQDAIRSRIRQVPDFPKPGILFYDITTLLKDPVGFGLAVDALADPFVGHPIEAVVAIESRGFILGAAVADRLKVGFVPVRKPGKLPARSERVTYDLEYGTDSLEIHADAIHADQRVLIVDDVLATGGTAKATTDLVRRLGGIVHAVAFLIELRFLNGRARLVGETIVVALGYDT
jgi:adenine phosphoribosyltransferase